MSRFDFSVLKDEPDTMQGYYDALREVQVKQNALKYVVPAELQIEPYAALLLSRANGPELATRRVDNRMYRETLLEMAGVPRRVFTTAAALQDLRIVGRDVLLAQIDRVQVAVETDIEDGPHSTLHVGIVPVTYIRPLSADLPGDFNLSSEKDVGLVGTHEGLYIHGPDAYEIDRVDPTTVRGREAIRRQTILNTWAAMAVYGEAALEVVMASRDAVLAG